jgi:hypothetical protein
VSVLQATIFGLKFGESIPRSGQLGPKLKARNNAVRHPDQTATTTGCKRSLVAFGKLSRAFGNHLRKFWASGRSAESSKDWQTAMHNLKLERTTG